MPIASVAERDARPVCSCTADARFTDPVMLARKQAINSNKTVDAIERKPPQRMREQEFYGKLVINGHSVSALNVLVALKAQYLSRFLQISPGITQVWSAPFAQAVYTCVDTGSKRVVTNRPVISGSRIDRERKTQRVEVASSCKAVRYCWDAKSQREAATMLPKQDTILPVIDYAFYIHSYFGNSVINMTYFLRDGFDVESRGCLRAQPRLCSAQLPTR